MLKKKFSGLAAIFIITMLLFAACGPIEGTIDEMLEKAGGGPDTRPVISGTVTIDITLPVVGNGLSAYYDANFGMGVTLTWQWLIDDVVVSQYNNKTGSSYSFYTVTEADLGKTIKARVSRSDRQGSISSSPTVIVTSYTGPTWAQVTTTESIFTTSSSDGDIDGVAWGGLPGSEVFIAVGKKMASSVDGIVWTQVTSDSFDVNSSFRGIIWTGDIFLASGWSGNIWYSSDGQNWDSVWEKNLKPYSFVGKIVQGKLSGNDFFIAQVSYYNEGSSVYGLIYSSDGVSWNLKDGYVFENDNVQCYTWGNNKFIAGSGKGNMAYSHNGKDWYPATDSNNIFGTDTVVGVFYIGGRYISSQANLGLASSPDGIGGWTREVTGENMTAFRSIYIVSHVGGNYIAVASASSLMYSTVTLAYSTDGIDWIIIPDIDLELINNGVRGVAYGNGTCVIVGGCGGIGYSN